MGTFSRDDSRDAPRDLETRERVREKLCRRRGKPKASGETTDVVKRVFIEQQTKFRALLTKTKDLKPPVGGDAAAVKAYASKKLAALKELDISTPGEKILETVDGAFAEAASVRGFLEYAGELRQMLGLNDEDDTMKVMVSALDETEKALGKALLTSDAQAWRSTVALWPRRRKPPVLILWTPRRWRSSKARWTWNLSKTKFSSCNRSKTK